MNLNTNSCTINYRLITLILMFVTALLTIVALGLNGWQMQTVAVSDGTDGSVPSVKLATPAWGMFFKVLVVIAVILMLTAVASELLLILIFVDKEMNLRLRRILKYLGLGTISGAAVVYFLATIFYFSKTGIHNLSLPLFVAAVFFALVTCAFFVLARFCCVPITLSTTTATKMKPEIPHLVVNTDSNKPIVVTSNSNLGSSGGRYPPYPRGTNMSNPGSLENVNNNMPQLELNSTEDDDDDEEDDVEIPEESTLSTETETDNSSLELHECQIEK